MNYSKEYIGKNEMQRHNFERYRSVLEVSCTGVWEYDKSKNLMWCSPEYFTMLGYETSEFKVCKGDLDRVWTELLHPEDRPEIYKYFKEYVENQQNHTFDVHFRMKRKDGSWAWIRSRGRTIADREGCPNNLTVGTHVDITELKETQNKLKQQEKEERLQDLDIIFDSTHDAMFLINVEGKEFRFARNNRAHQKLTGLSHEMISGKTPCELVGEELGALISTNYTRCLESGETTEYEETMSFLDKELTFLTSLTPVYENGRIRNIVGASKDITERKKFETEINELSKRNQAMFNDHTAVMILLDPESGSILDSNPAASDFYGYTRDELLKIKIGDINMLDKSELENRIVQAKDGRQRYFIFPHRLKNGEIKLVDVYTAPLNINGKRVLYSIIFDVTARENFRNELIWRKEQYETTLMSIGDGVISTDIQGNVTVMNKIAEDLTGWSEADAIGQPFEKVFNIIHEYTRRPCVNPVEKVFKTGEIVYLANHTILISKTGEEVSIEDSAAPIKDKSGRITGVVVVFRDFTDKKEKQDQIEYLSFRDYLTGLYNRRYIEDTIKRINTKKNFPITVLAIDVNGLKLTNDAYGHQVGDELLKSVGKIIKNECRKDDIVGRVGGDEFIVILPNTDEKRAEKIKQNILSKAAKSKIESIIVSLSIGYAVKKSVDEDIDDIRKIADNLMYKDKLKFGKTMRSKTIETVLKNINLKYDQEQIHTERVSLYCGEIAKKMGFSEREVEEITKAGILHDIGKIMVPPELLNKPSKLTFEEFEIIKRHPQTGYQILKTVDEYASMAESVLHHHERWDGNGYPEGLKGEKIPLVSRIIAVADVYEAMTANRPYQKTKTKKEAINELMRCAGTQFDPEIVDVFVQLMK
ncbi:PAS domain S-box protein [Alkalibacter sp. M17DMB]|nr:PAS domain S-box protein [Alkalibacter mobilis]